MGLRAVSAALGGLVQGWVLLRRLSFPAPAWRALATGLGSGLALLLVALGGAIVGAVQLPLLRGRLAGAAGWSAVSAAAALLAEAVVALFRVLLAVAGVPVPVHAVHPGHGLITAAAASIAALLSGGFLLWRHRDAPLPSA